MRSTFLVCLAAIVWSVAHAGPPASPETWNPVRVFVGSWTGSRTGGDGARKILRTYEPVADNSQLQILERSSGRFGVWGVISIDADHQRLVLRQFRSDGHTSVLALDPSASNQKRLVFESAEDDPDRIRITYQQMSWDEFTERIESVQAGGGLGLVSEARFTRKP